MQVHRIAHEIVVAVRYVSPTCGATQNASLQFLILQLLGGSACDLIFGKKSTFSVRTMKKNKSRAISKTRGNDKEIDGKAVLMREAGIEGIRKNANYTIEAAFSNLKNEYKKMG